MRVLLALSVLIGFTLVSCQTEDKLTPESICTLVQEGKYVRDVEDCRIYYQCIEGKPVKQSCPEGNIFDKEKGTCIQSTSCDPAVQNKCNRKVDGFVTDSKSCAGYHWCQGGKVIGRGECPEGLRFDEGVNGGSCVYEDQKKCIREESICNHIKSGEYFGSPNNCNSWRLCVPNGPIDEGTCPEKYVLNLKDGSCDFESDCRQLGGNTDKPITKPPPPATTECPADSATHIKDGHTCGGFYYCEKGKTLGRWGQCVNNKFFDGTLCVDRTETVCEEDRCHGMGEGVTWVNIPGDGCVGYHFCENGKRMEGEKPGKCNGWFDEKVQKCVQREVTYPACAKTDPTPEPAEPNPNPNPNPDPNPNPNPNPNPDPNPNPNPNPDPNPNPNPNPAA